MAGTTQVGTVAWAACATKTPVPSARVVAPMAKASDSTITSGTSPWMPLITCSVASFSVMIPWSR